MEDSEPNPELDALDAAIGGIVQYARVGEKIVSATTQLSRLAEDLAEIVEQSDGDLAPELLAAVEHLSDAGDAMKRALTTALTIASVHNTQILDTLNEGGPSHD